METFFETIKCDDFTVYNLEYHKKRMANTTGINYNLEEYIYPPNQELIKCKIVYNKDEIIDIKYDKYTKKEISSFKLIYSDTISYNYKSTNREAIDKLYIKKDIANEIIIIKNDLVTDTSIANLAIFINDTWYTPKTPLLNGTTRQRYIDRNILKEKDITVDMLKSATKIATLNAMVDFNIIEEFNLYL